MPRSNPGGLNPWVLVAIAVGLLAAACFFYTGHPVRDSNLYSPHATGWIAFIVFVLIPVLWRLADQWRPRKPEKKDQDDASRKI